MRRVESEDKEGGRRRGWRTMRVGDNNKDGRVDAQLVAHIGHL